MCVISLNCPHCLKENVAFQSLGEKKLSLEKKTDMVDEWIVFLSCGNCQQGVMAYVLQYSQNSGSVTPGSYRGGLEGTKGFTIVKTYPQAKPISAPDHLPDNIAALYLQAAKNLKPDMWDSAAMMGRRVLEVALKRFNPDLNGSLYKRIEILADKSIITQDMKDWAHEIRLDGNEAAHSEQLVGETKAKELMSFVELFLMYTFSLPGMLNIRRKNMSSLD